MAITEISLSTQALDATLIPSKISTNPADNFTFPGNVSLLHGAPAVILTIGSDTLSEIDFSSGNGSIVRTSIAGTAVGDLAIDVTPGNTLFIGDSGSPDPSAYLQVESTTQGLLPPRLTTSQRNLIASPAAGLQIYNTTTNQPEVYNGTSWVPMGGSTSFVDDVFTAPSSGTGQIFTLSQTPVANSEVVNHNGLVLRPTTDYTISGTTLTILENVLTGESIQATYAHDMGGTSVTPGGPNTSVQFNNGGTFDGSANLEYSEGGGENQLVITATGGDVPLLRFHSTAQGGEIQIQNDTGSVTLVDLYGDPAGNYSIYANGTITLSTDAAGASPLWLFDAVGALTTPGDITLTGGNLNFTDPNNAVVFDGDRYIGGNTGPTLEINNDNASGTVHINTAGSHLWNFNASGVLVTPGAIDLATHQIHNVVDPTSAQDAATKNYVDGGAHTVAGANTQIQFNNSGAFGASASLTWNGSDVTIGGGLRTTGLIKSNLVTTSSASYTVLSTDYTVLGNAAGNVINVTLPAASAVSGRILNFKKTDSSANAVNVNRAGADLIDGQTSVPLTVQYQSVTIQSDGTNWNIL